MKRMLILFALSAVLLINCAHVKPSWIGTTSEETDSAIYFVGSSEKGYQDAFLQAAEYVSYYAHGSVDTDASEYAVAVSDSINRLVKEGFNSASMKSSRTELTGIMAESRWYDSVEELYWVKLKIDKVKFAESLELTIAEKTRELEVIQKNSLIADKILVEMSDHIKRVDSFTEELFYVTDAYKAIKTLEFSKELRSSSMGTKPVLSYLSSRIAYMISQIEIQQMAKTARDTTAVHVAVPGYGTVGTLWWQAKNREGEIAYLQTNQEGVGVLPGTELKETEWEYLSPDFEKNGITIPTEVWAPDFSLKTFSVGEAINFDDSFISENGYESKIREMFREVSDLPYQYEELYPFYSLDLHTVESDRNEVLVAVRTVLTLTVHIAETQRKDITTENFVGYGSDFASAKEDSIKRLINYLRVDYKFREFIKESLDETR